MSETTDSRRSWEHVSNAECGVRVKVRVRVRVRVRSCWVRVKG